ncbi:MAG: hypothetical protein F6K42_33255 [Leptolyngbya sp. SIO1D8]|nr:hypothetical protein [Leptolyngbya sp. SIO1D8]
MEVEATANTLPEQLLDVAQRFGAEAAEVFQSSSFAQPIFFEANRPKQLESNQLEGTALRLWRDGRPGIAVGYGPIDPQVLVEKAIAISQLNESEAIELTASKAQHYPDVGVAVPISQLIEWGETTIAQIRDQYPEVICEVELECDVETTRIVNSLGLDYGYSDTTLSSYLGAEWVRGDDFLSVSDGQVCRDALSPEKLAEQVLKRLTWAKRNVTPVVGRVPSPMSLVCDFALANLI